MEAPVYNKIGSQEGIVILPDSIFNIDWNADLVHQIVVGMQANARTNVAHTKNRAEVSGGGKKPWKQKGTGRARHGSIRSPLWRGGGVSHGPRNTTNFAKTVTKKMRIKALYVALSRKFKDGEILFVKDLAFEIPKAKDARAALVSLAKISGFETLSTKRKNAALVIVPPKATATKLSFRNFGNVEVEEARNVNPLDVLTYKYLIITSPEESVAHFARERNANTK